MITFSTLAEEKPSTSSSSILSPGAYYELTKAVINKDQKRVNAIVNGASCHFAPNFDEIEVIRNAAVLGVANEIRKVQEHPVFRNIVKGRLSEKSRIVDTVKPLVLEKIAETVCTIPFSEVFNSYKPSAIAILPKLLKASFAISGSTESKYSDDDRIRFATECLSEYGIPFVPQYLSEAAKCTFLISLLASNGEMPLKPHGLRKELERVGSIDGFLKRNTPDLLVDLRVIDRKETYTEEQMVEAIDMVLRGDDRRNVEAYLRHLSEPNTSDLACVGDLGTTTKKIIQYTDVEKGIANLILMRRDFANGKEDETRLNQALRASRRLVHLITTGDVVDEDKLNLLRGFVSDPKNVIDEKCANEFRSYLKRLEQPYAFLAIERATESKQKESKKKK